MLNTVTKAAVILLVLAVMAPAYASASSGRSGDDGRDDRGDDRRIGAWTTNEFGVKVFSAGTLHDQDNDRNKHKKNNDDDKKDKKQKDKQNQGLRLGEFFHKGFYPNMFYNGTVTATSSGGFTIKTKNDTTFTVDADSAKIIQIPRAEINLSEIEVGDRVHITGNKTSDTAVNASVIYVLPANLNPAISKGTITAVDGDKLTVQTKEDASITVNTNSDTVITNSEGETVDQSDVEVGTKAKLVGFWDSVLNVFNAVRIKLF